MTALLLPDEASRTSGEAAVALFRADDDEGLAGAAPGDAHGVLCALDPRPDERPFEGGLHDLAGEHGRGGVGTIELEASAGLSVLDRRRLHVVQELSLTHASRDGERRGQCHEGESPSHARPPWVWCPARECRSSIARSGCTCEGHPPRPCPWARGGYWRPISC